MRDRWQPESARCRRVFFRVSNGDPPRPRQKRAIVPDGVKVYHEHVGPQFALGVSFREGDARLGRIGGLLTASAASRTTAIDASMSADCRAEALPASATVSFNPPWKNPTTTSPKVKGYESVRNLYIAIPVGVCGFGLMWLGYWLRLRGRQRAGRAPGSAGIGAVASALLSFLLHWCGQ